MHLLWTLIIGQLVGGVAKLLMPWKDPGGITITILLGIAGSVRRDVYRSAHRASTVKARRPASSCR
jgi:uncharacterized membrane protein YeaQ/YmgE (transglycosylase-associated protein family)